jgi:hypothetical protein
VARRNHVTSQNYKINLFRSRKNDAKSTHSAVQPSLPAWEEKAGMTMQTPEPAQNLEGGFRQGNQPVLVALGVADMDPHVDGIDISHLEADALAKTQAKAVGGEEKHPVAHPVGGVKQLFESVL